MNAPVVEKLASQQLSIVDCDIHPSKKSGEALYPYFTKKWQEHLAVFGLNNRQGMVGQQAYSRMMAGGVRADSFPETGGPGSDLNLMRRQHLDPNGVEIGMMLVLTGNGAEEQNQDFAEALARAVNDWQIEEWVKPEPRLRGSIVVPQEDPAAAVAEIERCAAQPGFLQILLSPRSTEPLGRRRYWPIFEAAERVGLPIALHPANVDGGYPSTGSGWPTYYLQEHYAFQAGMQGILSSLLFEGVFERFPKLRVLLVESGFTWIPAACWRMDKIFERMRKEVQHLKRKPSEYVRENLWFATQPIEEPENPAHLADMIDWLGWDRLVFSSDYPHWDFDDPRYTFRVNLTERQRAMIFRDNAKALYRLS